MRVARSLLAAAERAYNQGNLDQRSLVDYETTVLDRELNVVGYQRTLEEDSLALSVELGLGLPQTMIPPPDAKEAHI
jgi:outer membrane protein TolC